MEWSDNEVFAYIGGLLDGEGTIRFASSGRGRRPMPQILVTNNEKRIMDWLMKKFPAGHVYPKKRTNPNSKICYRFVISKHDKIKTFLDKIYPYLIIKKKHGELMLKYLEMHPVGRHNYRVRDEKGKFKGIVPVAEEERLIMQELNKLNKRGTESCPDPRRVFP